ncbi:hypothetical protein [Streptomyces omiyaensis]|uniref:hypothetical protein n=1 Tax=Streptomyces omiyaensis TaxID=68247 RepID=UPI0036FA74D9
MSKTPEPIRKSLLPATPPPEWEFASVLAAPHGCALIPTDTGAIVVRRRVTYGDWEPVRLAQWADEPPAGDRADTSPTTHAAPPPGSGLTSCCRRSPFELPHTDRMTSDLRASTCRQSGGLPGAAPDDCPNCDHPFLIESCTCRPWTRQTDPARYLEPGDTVDMISGFERGADCPHHRPTQQQEAR